MKILLVAPPARSAIKEVLGVTSPPLGLAYIASVLENNGEDVKIIDSLAENCTLYDIKREIDSWGADIVGVTSTTPTFYDALKVAKIAKESGAVTVLGGPHVTFTAKETLSNYSFVDYVVRGEGEFTMLELVKSIKNGEEPKSVLGLSYRAKSGVIKENRPRPPLMNLDALPMPAYHLLPMSKYTFQGYRFATMVTSRGCPFKCVFCSSSRICGKRWRGHSAERVVNEIEFLTDRYKIKFIEFLDDTFTFDKNRVKEICNEIANRGIDVMWTGSSRVNLFNRELALKIKSAGCQIVYFGVESGSQRILNLMKKGITLEQSVKAIRLAKEVGINTVASFILGMPDESVEEANATIKFATRLSPDYAQFTICTPYPGTELYDYAVKNDLLLTRDWSKYDALTPVMKTKISIRKLRELLSKAYFKFYARLSYLFDKIRKREFVIFRKGLRAIWNYIKAVIGV
ncbi:MAG: radical SAM protein [Candidatus Baldrarchaeota archaeon]